VNNLDDAEIIAAARVGFLDEAADMLQQFEQALLVMESTPEDAENLNAAFRAAHTIKGTAGLFGCDAVVSFTHEVETLLEALRSGQLAVTEDISAALLEGRDQMQALIDEVRTGAAEASVSQRSVTLGEQLRRLHGAGRAPEPPRAAPAASAATASAAATAGLWHLSLRFGADALRNGLDPLAFLRYLGKLGTITARHTFTDQVPALAALDAEACYLGFELRMSSEASQSEIEAVFGQRRCHLLRCAKVRQGIAQQPANQEFEAEVIDPLGPGLMRGGGGIEPAVDDVIAQGKHGGIVPVMRLGRALGLADAVAQRAEDAGFELTSLALGHSRHAARTPLVLPLRLCGARRCQHDDDRPTPP